MQPIAKPPRLATHEYVYAYGYKSRDACTLAIWDAMSNGEVSAGERPREAAYTTAQGARRWAIVLTASATALA